MSDLQAVHWLRDRPEHPTQLPGSWTNPGLLGIRAKNIHDPPKDHTTNKAVRITGAIQSHAFAAPLNGVLFQIPGEVDVAEEVHLALGDVVPHQGADAELHANSLASIPALVGYRSLAGCRVPDLPTWAMCHDGKIVSSDEAFDRVEEVERVDPTGL